MAEQPPHRTRIVSGSCVLPRLFLSLVLVLLPLGCVYGQTRPLKSAILLDLQRVKVTEDSLNAAIAALISNNSGVRNATGVAVSPVFKEQPAILNSKGSLLTALLEVERFLQDNQADLDVLFLAENVDVSLGVNDALRQNSTTANITIISIHASHPRLCDTRLNPTTVCIMPWDSTSVRGVLETVVSVMEWHSVSAVFSSDTYGRGIASIMEAQLSIDHPSPRVVTQVHIKSTGTTEDDDNVIREVLRYSAAGVLCFVGEEEFLRLRAAAARLGKEDDLFLLGSHEAINAFDEMNSSVAHFRGKLWGAIFVSQHTSASSLVKQGYFEPQHMGSYSAHIVSHLFDALQAVSMAEDASPVAIRGVQFEGFTGRVAFDASTGQRVDVVYSLLANTSIIEHPLVTWSLKFLAEEAVITNYNPTATASLILSSPLRAVTVCMAAASSCFEMQSLNAMLFVFLRHNQQAAEAGNETMFIPLVINTGAGGVDGLISLIPVARSCSVLLGPGRGYLSLAFEPVINQFAITQLDFNTADILFSDRIAHPYFSRTIPSDMFNYLIYGEICAYFAWERVLIVALNDQFGGGRLHAMQRSMEQRNIHVERVYTIPNLSKEQMKLTMETIYERDISRIIITLLPANGNDAQAWFSLFDDLDYMKQYIFFLSRELCHYSVSNPEERGKAQSSICVFPHVPQDRLHKINNEANMSGLLNDQMQILSQGGFAPEKMRCDMKTIGSEAGFAVDAALTVIDSAKRAVASGVKLNSSRNLMPFVRSTSLDVFTGPFKIDTSGNRDSSSFGVNIQVSNRTLFLGTWNLEQLPPFRYMATEPFLWMTGSSEIPSDTFRDIQFILGTTMSASPGTIVLSLLGFLSTIAVFAFCYRHYKMQKLIELTLASNCVPVTDEELRWLRGGRSAVNGV